MLCAIRAKDPERKNAYNRAAPAENPRIVKKDFGEADSFSDAKRTLDDNHVVITKDKTP